MRDKITSNLSERAAENLLEEVDLADPGIYALDLLNEVLAERDDEPVDGLVDG